MEAVDLVCINCLKLSEENCERCAVRFTCQDLKKIMTETKSEDVFPYTEIQEHLCKKILNDTIINIEDFLGYPISSEILESGLEDRVREEELLLYEQKYSLQKKQ